MRIICCSDTHTKHRNLDKDLNQLGYDEETIIIHAGDCTNEGRHNELIDFLNWFSDLPYKYKVFIAGNHDFCFEPKLSAFPPIYPDIPDEYKAKGVIYLMDNMVELDGIKIYGSPWQPEFYDWAFNVKRGEAIAKKWANIPKDLDILVTHGPAFGILDDTNYGLRVGCEELYRRIFEVKPRYHICGHIHYGYGVKTFDDVTFINASNLNDAYIYNNKPIVFNI